MIFLQVIHHNYYFERLPFINVQFSRGTGYPDLTVALLSPGWMPSNPTESFVGAPKCLMMAWDGFWQQYQCKWIFECAHDIFQSCDQKRAYGNLQGKKKSWDTVKSTFAFTYGSKCSHMFYFFHRIQLLLSLRLIGKQNKTNTTVLILEKVYYDRSDFLTSGDGIFPSEENGFMILS